MSDEPEDDDGPEAEALAARLSDLLPRAMVEAMRHQDLARLRAWVDGELESVIGEDSAPDERRALAWSVARSAWSSAPLPGSGYRPVRLLQPERNTPCFCGSGRKFKKCCGHFGAELPIVPEDEAWAAVAPQMKAEEAILALRARTLQAVALVPLGERLRELGQSRRAARLLDAALGRERRPGRPFAGAVRFRLDLEADRRGPGAALSLGLGRLPDLASEARPAVLRHLVLLAIDVGKVSLAGELVDQARDGEPEHPELAFVEVVARLVEGRLDVASRRARFWIGWMSAAGIEEEEAGVFSFLERVADDPAGAREDLRTKSPVDEGAGLPDDAGLDDPEAGEDDDGFLPELVWSADLSGLVTVNVRRPIVPHPLEDRGEGCAVLLAPSDLAAVLAEWREAWPCAKPLLTSLDIDIGPTLEDPGRWLGVLRRHPAAFDLVEVLDDLTAAAGMALEQEGSDVAEALLDPLVDRGVATVESSLRGRPGVRLPWGFEANRPALRLLTQKAHAVCVEGPTDAAISGLERLLALNPSDEHGHRARLADFYLRTGQPGRVLELAGQFPGDRLPSLLFGTALALLRVGREEEAQTALREAAKHAPRVAWALVAPGDEIEDAWERVLFEPQAPGDGVVSGSEEEALDYREDMIEEWEKTAAALDILRRLVDGS